MEPARRAGVEIAIDVGGTFTDVICVGEGQAYATKVPTTPGDLTVGVLSGIEAVLRLAGKSYADMSRIVHGTTVATNALIQKSARPVLLLTTKGFEDVLEIGRLKRSEMYNLFCDPETPAFLAPGRLRAGISERIGPSGEVLAPLDEEELVEVVDRLVARYNPHSVAVCFLFSFVNPVHERRAKGIVRKRYPGLKISVSSEIDPVIREYERTCVTAFDAYLRPVVQDYLEQLQSALTEKGARGTLYIMQSRGGITTVDSAMERAVQLLYSGPAAGVIGAREEAVRSGFRNFVSLDMGGTSCDVCLVTNASPSISTENKIGTYPLRLPIIDVNTIGAGGGSIAWLDGSGGMRVGPLSAGSDPGPASYRRGGTRPTVTDASIVLGYLNSQYFAGGRFELDPGRAEEAILTHVARPLNLDLLQAAWGIHRIVNSNMAEQVRLVSIRRGFDPRRFALVVFGGAGPVHGAAIAQELGIPHAIVPHSPGVLSAAGLLAADIEHDFALAYLIRADQASAERTDGIWADLRDEILERMRKDVVDPTHVVFRRFADMRYIGQTHELTVHVPDGQGPEALATAVARFHEIHQQIYGHCSPDRPIEFVSLRAVGVFRFGGMTALVAGRPGETLEDAYKSSRPAYFGSGAPVRVPVYDRRRLPLGIVVDGPAILEQEDTTTVIYPGQSGIVDEAGNVIISIETRGWQ